MSVRPIVLYAESPEILRKKSQNVKGDAAEVAQLITDLKDTLLSHSDGIGLAAPQIGVNLRAIVVCLGFGPGEERKPPMAIINPVILEAGREQPDFDGCLSFPGLYGETIRPHFIRLSGMDESGRQLERTLEGFDAVVVHHEVDHLNGVLFIDRAADGGKLFTKAEARRA